MSHRRGKSFQRRSGALLSCSGASGVSTPAFKCVPSVVVGGEGVERDEAGDIGKAQLIKDLVGPLGWHQQSPLERAAVLVTDCLC